MVRPVFLRKHSLNHEKTGSIGELKKKIHNENNTRQQ